MGVADRESVTTLTALGGLLGHYGGRASCPNTAQGQSLTQPDWRDLAVCAQTDPEAFFPEKGGSTREAKRICSGCDVRAECLEYALAHDERFGIWGGLSENERRPLRRAAREKGIADLVAAAGVAA